MGYSSGTDNICKPFLARIINADEANKLQTILNKAKRSNFLPSDFSALEELFDSADCALFRAVLTIPEHVLHPLLPPRKTSSSAVAKRPRDTSCHRIFC